MVIDATGQKPPMIDVLIVDDQAGLRRMLRRVVEGEGFEVAEAESAEEALLVADQTPPRIAFCDVEMPGGRNGFWLAQELNRLFPSTVVVMVTSKHQMDAVVAGVRAGSRVYLVKPVAPDMVRETLKSGFEEHAIRVQSGAATRTAPLGE